MFGIYLIIAMMVFTLVCAASAPFIFAGARAGSRRDAIAKYVGGAAYICMGTLGLMTFQYLPKHHLITIIIGVLIIGVGVWMIQSGNKISQALKQNKKDSR